MGEQLNYYQFRNGELLEDEEMSRIMETIMDFRPHKSKVYTWDDIGTATLMSDLYNNEIRYCPQNGRWYFWDKCWRKQGEDGVILDRLQTMLNLLLLYADEVPPADDTDAGFIADYKKYVKTLRKNHAMKNVLDVMKSMVRMSLKDMDLNPYLLNTTTGAYDLKEKTVIDNIRDFNVTKITTCGLPNALTQRCNRWYQFIDEIMSHDKEKAAFLQRAIGYSILGENREECMFFALGRQTRNGKGTLFNSVQAVLGEDYSDSVSPELICESKTGKIADFNAPQPALAKLVGTRFVVMSESNQDVRLASASMKTITGRDKLNTRDLYESSFSFVPQFTLWLNTNYLPSVTDDTVFASDRIWVIEFNEKFEGNKRDLDLKPYFADPANRPTILEWIYNGCRDYLEHGLNPPACVVEATRNYRRSHDRIGTFIEDCCEMGDKYLTSRGDVYAAYQNWCRTPDKNFKALGSTSFYNELARRGFPGKHKNDGDYIEFIRVVKDNKPKFTIK